MFFNCSLTSNTTIFIDFENAAIYKISRFP